MRSVRGWLSDLVLGVRLAVGGGRTSLVRFALSTLGIAVAVTVLLVGASVGHMVTGHQQRQHADSVGVQEPVPGVDPVYYQQNPTEFRGERIDVAYVYAAGEHHPVPAGMRELPGPGELVASPALADLLRSPEGELLRPRFRDRMVGELDESLVPEPGDLVAYVGAQPAFADSPDALAVYRFGGPVQGAPLPPELLLLIPVGAVVLLVPVFIFVASASRIAGAERDRRLSALRLVGAGSRQTRRIAAAEALVSALAGLLLGAGAFLVLRGLAEHVELFSLRVYESDVVPDPVLVVLIVVAVPVLAVLTALVALRRTIIEPLRVVRRARPVRRRLWWRLAPIVAGVALLVSAFWAAKGATVWVVAVAAGASLLLVGVPVLLPWLVERVAGRIEGGPASWQLAIRRLQLDSGTSARVVGGVAVVLAGAIALQTILMTVELDLNVTGQSQRRPTVEVLAESAIADGVVADLGTVPAVRAVHAVRSVTGYLPGSDRGDDEQYLNVMDCAAVRDLLRIHDCTDGQVFSLAGRGPRARAGMTLEFRRYARDQDVSPQAYEKVGTWSVPELTRVPAPDGSYTELVVTPGALRGVRLPDGSANVRALVGDLTSDDLERIRNSVAEFGPHVYVYSYDTAVDLSTSRKAFVSLRNGLYAGAVFTLLLAGVSLLVLALEHIRERRRPLSVLAATGVPQGVLARSLLWQVALPIALGVLVAVLTGVGLAWLIVRLTGEEMAIDWAGVGYLSGAAALLALVVSALTLPFLRGATRLTSLRTE